jgi:hypothetical protein
VATTAPAPAGESEEDIDGALPSWALGTAFVLIVAMLPAMVIIASVTDLSEAQMDVFNIALGIVAVVLGVGFGVAIQAGNVRSARRERDRERAQRIADLEEERGKRAEAVRAAEEAEQARSAAAIEAVEVAERERSAEALRAAEEAAEARRAEAVAAAEATERARAEERLAAARDEVLEILAASRGPRIRTVSAAKLKSAKFLKKARKSKDAYYVKASAKDEPTGTDHDALTDEITRAFDESAD